MSNERKTFKMAGNLVEFSSLVEEVKGASMKLARGMLAALEPETHERLFALTRLGWRIALEVSADQHGVPWVVLTAVEPGPDGKRKVLAEVPQVAPGAAN